MHRSELDVLIQEWKAGLRDAPSFENIKKGQMDKLDGNKEAFETPAESSDEQQEQALQIVAFLKEEAKKRPEVREGEKKKKNRNRNKYKIMVSIEEEEELSETVSPIKSRLV